MLNLIQLILSSVMLNLIQHLWNKIQSASALMNPSILLHFSRSRIRSGMTKKRSLAPARHAELDSAYPLLRHAELDSAYPLLRHAELDSASFELVPKRKCFDEPFNPATLQQIPDQVRDDEKKVVMLNLIQHLSNKVIKKESRLALFL
jgi:hypothetical protein